MDELISPQARTIQEAPPRDTEGRQPEGAAFQEKASETKRARGRPKGAKNKAKPIFTPELLLKLKGELTQADYDYLEKVVSGKQDIDVKREVQIMYGVLGRNLLPLLFEETKGEEEEAYLRKDVTERLKVWNSLSNILHNIEKNVDDESNTKEKPILSVFERSGVDPGRIKILISHESRSVGGSPDGVGGAEVDSGTISDQLPDGSLDVQDSEQESPVGVLNPDSNRDGSRGVHTA